MAHFGYFSVDIFDCPPFEMFSNNDDPRAPEILDQRSFEPHSMRLWCHYARNATSILDIGAHSGVYALAACALRSDIPVHAFEANPYTAGRLRVNKHRNGFHNLHDHLAALSDEKAATVVHWAPKPGGNLASGAGLQTERREGWETAAVFSYPLDSLNIDPGPRPLVKIDVEGAEVLVMRGMRQYLAALPVILLETFHPEKAAAITAMLGGYSFYRVAESGALRRQDRIRATETSDDGYNHLLLPAWAELPKSASRR